MNDYWIEDVLMALRQWEKQLEEESHEMVWSWRYWEDYSIFKRSILDRLFNRERWKKTDSELNEELNQVIEGNRIAWFRSRVGNTTRPLLLLCEAQKMYGHSWVTLTNEQFAMFPAEICASIKSRHSGEVGENYEMKAFA